VTGSDDEFEDFLKRRKPIFRKPDDMFEPPAEIDRIVLRQARDAIETEQPLRVFRAPRWATPLALAATLVLAFTVIFQAGMPPKKALVPEVTVQNVAQRIEEQDTAAPAVMAPAATADDRGSDAAVPAEAVADLSQPMAASHEMPARPAPPAAAPAAARSAGDGTTRERRADATGDAPSRAVSVPAAKSTGIPRWRRDSKTWLAEIERLRNAGDTARASAELEEYKRQHRAYAAGPDQ
jgi:hypothetical protein